MVVNLLISSCENVKPLQISRDKRVSQRRRRNGIRGSHACPWTAHERHPTHMHEPSAKGLG